MFKKIMATLLALATVFSLAACSGNEGNEGTSATKENKTTDAVATEVITNEEGETEIVTVDDTTDENGTTNKEDKTTDKEDKTSEKTTSDKTTDNNNKTTNNNGTTNQSTTTPTKPNKTFVVPSSTKDIVIAYKNAANKSKAQNNMTVDKTCDVDINIVRLGGTILTKIAAEVADYFMNQAKGDVETEVFKNGLPTKNTEKKNGKFVTDKSTFIPIYGESYMCTLDPANVKSAVVTKKTNSTYDVKIVLKDDKCSITGVPKITVSGMDYFNPNLYTEDLKGISFSKGTVYYTECVITATIDKDGYLDFVKHDMKLKTNDTVVKFLGANIDAALTGRYVTTFKFR
ncbi:MAG: hypothetical protein IJM97_08680 [Clostridia bacterium]|nr:hypothetical protein [Clostridia bacterium]